MTHHSRYDSSGRRIGTSLRRLPDNAKYSQETDILALGGIRTRNPSKRATARSRLARLGYWNRSRFEINDNKLTRKECEMVQHDIQGGSNMTGTICV
jgi:hypothetical protein